MFCSSHAILNWWIINCTIKNIHCFFRRKNARDQFTGKEANKHLPIKMCSSLPRGFCGWEKNLSRTQTRSRACSFSFVCQVSFCFQVRWCQITRIWNVAASIVRTRCLRNVPWATCSASEKHDLKHNVQMKKMAAQVDFCLFLDASLPCLQFGAWILAHLC